MKNILLLIGLTVIIATGCDDKPEVDKKKEALKNAQSELKALSTQISSLEKEISVLDPDFGKKEIKKTLITAFNAEKKYFEHKVEVRGSVESRKNVTVSPEIAGKIKSILVKEGQKVQKGQTLLTIDASIIRNNIKELKTSMELSKTVYERQANLWKRNIGTEIQYLQSKNNYESLEGKLATLNSQLDQAIIKAPFSGSIDQVMAKEGEIAQPGMPLFRVVNPEDVYIKSDVSERFIGVFKSGDKVDVHFPSQDQTIVSTITSVGQVINSQNRTFEIQVDVPSGFSSIRPNQVVVLQLKDYTNEEAITVPTMVILKGSYVFSIVKEGSELVAKKAHIETGISYNNATEILTGINPGQKIANKGVRDLAEGVLVSLNSNN